MKIWMNRIEQRVMAKYFFLKGHGSKLVYKELVTPLQGIRFHCPPSRIGSRDSNPAIFLAAMKNGLEDFSFLWPSSSACSEEVSLRECSSNHRAFLGGSGYHQEDSWSETMFEKIRWQMVLHILWAEQTLRRVM
jgi:hypothetical protein